MALIHRILKAVFLQLMLWTAFAGQYMVARARPVMAPIYRVLRAGVLRLMIWATRFGRLVCGVLRPFQLLAGRILRPLLASWESFNFGSLLFFLVMVVGINLCMRYEYNRTYVQPSSPSPQPSMTVRAVPTRTSQAWTTTSFTHDYLSVVSSVPSGAWPTVGVSTATAIPATGQEDWNESSSGTSSTFASSLGSSVASPAPERHEDLIVPVHHHHHHSHSASESPCTASHDGPEPSLGPHVNSPRPAHQRAGSVNLIVLGYRASALSDDELAYCDLCKQSHGFTIMTAQRKVQFEWED